MIRRFAGFAVLASLVLALLPPSVGAQEAPPDVPDHLRAFSIVPPGQNGFVDATLSTGPHYSDQLDTYASLINDDNVTEGELGTYFHSMQFGPGTIERSYSPAEGVTVYRDELGIPHIYADSMDAASFALGYVSAEDRLWQMDVFRHAARGTLAELIGAGEDDVYLEMDKDTRRNGYTAEEVQAMLDSFDDDFGAVGATVQQGLDAYASGVNAYIDEAKTDPSKMPGEYAPTGNPPPAFPEDWSALDTAYLAILQLRVFGETAGGELQNAGLYAHLVERHGKKLGRAMYDDLVFQNDRRSPLTVPARERNFHTQNLGRTNWKSVAIPDGAAEVAQREARRATLRADILGSMGFRAPASNALLLSGRESATGNPMQIGAPQVGYGAPSFFMDVDVHAPGVDFRGPAVPGASALIPLGRGADYAWSLTTGYSDAVDTRVEKLCDPEGGEVTQDSNGYRFKRECRAMKSRTEEFIAKPAPADPQAPRVETETIYRTVHGPVIGRGEVDGKPVAFVKERFFWKRELDSIPQFYRWNAKVDSIDDFARAAKQFTMSFNAFYADAEDIGYFHVGFYPRRAKGVSPSLPTWGTGRWEWRGRRSYARQPKVVNPERGWVANWNNKPARGWDGQDGIKWGSIQRNQLLLEGMRRVTAGENKANLSDLVDVIREAATRDVRGAYLGPKLLRRLRGGADPEAADFVRGWVRAGAHRFNRDGNDSMDDGPALAIFDRWYDKLVHRIFDDELGDAGYALVAAPVTDYRPAGGSNFWFDFSVYVDNLLRRRSFLSHDYCDDRNSAARESCTDMINKSFRAALVELATEQGSDVSTYRVDAENIEFQAFGAGSVDPIPWQNRGTHNHVVEILSRAG